MSQLIIPPFGKPVQLKDYKPSYTGKVTKLEAQEEMKGLQADMAALQDRLYADSKRALLVIFQGLDASGKDGATRKVFDSVNPQGVRVISFKAPTADELARDFLWRIHQHAPPKGFIGIFNRSQYEDVLIVRVNQLVPEAVWQGRYEHINAFERLLSDGGTRILKFFLHISKDEQKQRFQERLTDPHKQWKFALGDLDVRRKWDDYQHAYEDALTRCHTEHAPWHIVPADKKWFRDLVITRAIVAALKEINPQYPPPKEDLTGVVIPD